MTLLTFVFAQPTSTHLQANFAILSWLAWGSATKRIIVLTDAPEHYAFVDDDRVIVEEVSPDQLAEWKGPLQFFWRVKIKAIEMIGERYPNDHVVYVDADTFCLSDPERLIEQLDGGRNILHAREGALSELPTNSEKKMWKQTRGKSFGGVTINVQHNMWNAGVVGVSSKNIRRDIPTALAICDDMLAANGIQWLTEQFSLSVALAVGQPILPANGIIGHYWGNKEGWNPLIGDFFLRHHLRGSTYAEQVKELRDFDFYQIPVYTKSSGTHRKLSAAVDKLFTKNVVAYAARSVDGSDRSERVLAKKIK